MARILRGDIVWAALESTRGHEQRGRRPVLVLSEEVFNKQTATVVAVALTSKPPKVGFPLVLELSKTKLPKQSWVKIGQVRTLSTLRLSRKISQVDPVELELVLEGLNEILGK